MGNHECLIFGKRRNLSRETLSSTFEVGPLQTFDVIKPRSIKNPQESHVDDLKREREREREEGGAPAFVWMLKGIAARVSHV